MKQRRLDHMNASSKSNYFIRLLLEIKKQRSGILVFLFAEILLVVAFSIVNEDGFLIHRLLVRLSVPQGETVREFWEAEELRMAAMRSYGSTFEKFSEKADGVTATKSYGRKLNGVMEGRWMFWYPGKIEQRWKQHFGLAFYYDTFEGYQGVRGQLAAVGYFGGGHRKGWWKFYNVGGSLDILRTGFYENDKMVKPGGNPLLIPGIVLALLILPVFNLQLAKVSDWIDKKIK